MSGEFRSEARAKTVKLGSPALTGAQLDPPFELLNTPPPLVAA